MGSSNLNKKQEEKDEGENFEQTQKTRRKRCEENASGDT